MRRQDLHLQWLHQKPRNNPVPMEPPMAIILRWRAPSLRLQVSWLSLFRSSLFLNISFACAGEQHFKALLIGFGCTLTKTSAQLIMDNLKSGLLQSIIRRPILR